ncbi:MAG: amino acid permease, partial [Aurantibacter sp.]
MGQTPKKNKLGLWMSTSLVVGNMIGAGIFLMPSALAAYGGIGIIGWLVSAAGALLLAKVFSNLSVLVPNKSGGPYAYSKIGFGDFAAFLVAWGYWISIWVSNAAIAIAFVSALSVFWPVLETNSLLAVVVGLSAIWSLTWVNSQGIRESGKVQMITTLLKLFPLALVILGGFFFFSWENFTPFNISGESTFGAISITAAMTLYAYMGVESATIPAENIENPGKTIPKATMLGTVITAMVYILGTAVVMGMIPLEALSKSPAPFADAMTIIGGEWGKNLIAFGAAVAAFGGLNGWILVQGQIASATAKDSLFPKLFKKENTKG